LEKPLLGKNTWNTVDDFLLPQSETKFHEIHKCFSQFPPKFKNISEEIKERLDTHERSWFFFEHFETQKMFAQNVDVNDKSGRTALFCAAILDEIEIVQAVLEAGVDIDKTDWNGWNALHVAACFGHLEIGKLLIDAGADLKIETKRYKETALQIAERFNHVAFVEMLEN
jgi:hypothetical protein